MGPYDFPPLHGWWWADLVSLPPRCRKSWRSICAAAGKLHRSTLHTSLGLLKAFQQRIFYLEEASLYRNQKYQLFLIIQKTVYCVHLLSIWAYSFLVWSRNICVWHSIHLRKKSQLLPCFMERKYFKIFSHLNHPTELPLHSGAADLKLDFIFKVCGH